MTEERAPVRVLDSTDVWIHGVGALGLVGALATAPLLHAPYLAEQAAFPFAPLLHAVSAFFALAAWLFHAVRVCLTWLAGGSPWGLVPRSGDVSAFVRALAWGCRLRELPPVWGRYSYRERFSYAAFAAALPLLAVTGLASAHPAATVNLLRAAGLGAAADLHAAAGALLVPVLLWHLYFSHLQPGVPLWNLAALTGKIPWEQVVLVRPDWSRALLREQEVAPAPEAPPVTVESLLSEGNRAAREGRFAEAEAAYLEALELYPGYAQALFNLGVSRMRSGDAAGAREALTKFLEQDPFSPMAPRARQMMDEIGGGPHG